MSPEIDICVQNCVDRWIGTPEELHEYIATTKDNLCLYNMTLNDVIPYYNRTGSNENLCPTLPRHPE